MGLVDLSTDLKSLRFGKDRLGGGSSGQPYIVKDIPDTLSEVGQTGGTDFLLRGGSLIVNKTIDDVSRLTKMFTNTKSLTGVFFTAKQLMLSRQAVRTQASPFIFNDGMYLPTSTIAQAGINAIGGHLYKQGILPVTQTTNKSLFGQPSYSKNLAEIIDDSTNRLISFTSGSLNILGNSDINVTSYSGGPGSILGIGKTNIRRATYTDEAFNLLNTALGQSYNASAFSYQQLHLQSNINKGEIKEDFRSELKTPPAKKDYSILPSQPRNYISSNIEKRVNLGSPGKIGNISSYQRGKYVGNIKQGALDLINAFPLYLSDSPNGDPKLDDLIPFRIGIIDNDDPRNKTYIHFRAYIKGLTDNYQAEWSSVKYVGRGEEFYRYGGFSREVSFGWTVVAQSREELIPMYQKLNYLASACAPDYSQTSGYMRGNLITLTIGDWFNEQVGIMTGINISVPDDSPWEIALTEDGKNNQDRGVKQLPHRIDVNGFNFKPIHNFVPQVQKNNFKEGEYMGVSGDYVDAYGKQRYINLGPDGQSYGEFPSGDLIDRNPNYLPKNISQDFRAELNEDVANTLDSLDGISNLNF
jgi:hypothetical protein|tara:strand:+ start:1338 stop:3086 length:1749 start_codon:yes stop_codon:yes gene_type:complete